MFAQKVRNSGLAIWLIATILTYGAMNIKNQDTPENILSNLLESGHSLTLLQNTSSLEIAHILRNTDMKGNYLSLPVSDLFFSNIKDITHDNKFTLKLNVRIEGAVHTLVIQPSENLQEILFSLDTRTKEMGSVFSVSSEWLPFQRDTHIDNIRGEFPDIISYELLIEGDCQKNNEITKYVSTSREIGEIHKLCDILLHVPQ